MKARKEIRIVNPPKDIYDAITKLASNESRTIGKQAEYLLRIALKLQK